MQTKLALAALALVNLPIAAHAAVSDDLVFCSKLTSPKERIACYDAAARIAARGTPGEKAGAVAIAPARMITKDAADHPAAYAAPPPERRPFHRAYVAAGGSYGIGDLVNFFVADPIFFGFSGQGAPKGASFVGAGGFNLQTGHLVVGLELSGRYGSEKFDQSFTAFTARQFGVIGSSTATYRVNLDSSVHAAVRAGFAIDDTMIFAKAGAGVAHFNETSTSLVNASICTAAAIVAGQIVCTARVPITSAPPTARNAWLPSLLFGLGIEHNFGPVFGRLEAEAEVTKRYNDPTESFWTARAMAAIGVRF